MAMMDEWIGISNRIAASSEAIDALVRFMSQHNEDSNGVHKEICARNKRVLADLISFETAHRAVLPSGVSAAILEFDSAKATLINDEPDFRRAKAGCLFLNMLSSDIGRLFAGQEVVIRLRTERAFLHLQQLLATDATVQEKWRGAFADREDACEKLGATHLLWHGIYAFKVNAAGARTDLVFNEPIDGGLVARTDSGLVLTEWKVSDGTDGPTKFKEARQQAEIYSQGTLSGLELSGFRFAIVVSRKQIDGQQIPDDLRIGEVTYRHINIAFEPRSPSVQARRVG